jgi:hypothetical protein
MNKFYCYCPVCQDNPFASKATSIVDAKTIIETHEKECHKGKPVGCFGKATEYPKFILDIALNT